MKIILLTFFWLFCFFWLIKSLAFFRNSGLRTRTLNIFFSLKLLCGLVLFLIYTFYYPYRNTSDAFRYFDDSQVIYHTAFSDPSSYLKMLTGINGDDPQLEKYYQDMETWSAEKNYSTTADNRTIVRVNAFISLFSGGVYFVHILFFCFFAFAGLTALFRFIKVFSPGKTEILSCTVFLAPSVLFWSSGVLKEALVFAFLGFFLFYVLRLIDLKDPRSIFPVVLFTALLSLIKIYVLLTLLPAILFLVLVRRKILVKPLIPFLIIAIMMGAAVLISSKLDPPVNPLPSLAEKQKDFINVAKGGTYLIDCHSNDTIYIKPTEKPELLTSDSIIYRLKPGTSYNRWTYWKVLEERTVQATDSNCYKMYLTLGATGSSFNITELEPTASSFFKILPEAYRNVLFRPFVSELDSIMIIFPFIENLLFLLYLLFCLWKFKKPEQPEIQLILFTILFIAGAGAIIGIVTPVTGALVRYRIVYIPLLLSSIAMLSDDTRFKKVLPAYLFGKEKH